MRRREVREEDAPALTALDARCFPPHIAYSLDYFEELLASPDVRGLVDEDGDGRVVSVILWSDAREGIGHLITIDVDPGVRRAGIGKGLMEAMHEHGRINGTRAIMLEVSTENEAATAFYLGLGYRHVMQLDDYYGPGGHAHLMMNRL